MVNEDRIEKYIEKYSSAQDSALEWLERMTNLRTNHARMLSGPVVGKFLEFVSTMLRPERILELGCFTGYSSICLARGLADGGRLDTIEIKKIARNYLKEISGITNETIHLLCKEGTEAIYIDKIDTPNTIGLKSQIGRHIPLYCTSGGKVLLAYSNVEYKLRFFSDVSLIQFTENTITQKDKLLAELERIKENGYALDDEEHHDNITCVAVPIFNVNGDVEYSVSVAAPSYRFSKTMAMSYVPALKKCAQQISEKLSILEVK